MFSALKQLLVSFISFSDDVTATFKLFLKFYIYNLWTFGPHYFKREAASVASTST